MTETLRLSKLLAQRGICSRREADRYIEAGLVEVDGECISVLGTKVPEDAAVRLLPKAQRAQNAKVTIILNKPLGYVSIPEERGYPVVTELLCEDRLHPDQKARFSPDHLKGLGIAGRLDVDSKGLMILSQDGTVIRQIIGPDSRMEKEYLVRTREHPSQAQLHKLRHGLFLDGEALRPAKVEVLGPELIRFILTQGKKRQIRRMCELVELKVQKLKRVRVGKYRLGTLPEGCWAYI